MAKFRVHECRAIAERALRLAADAQSPEAKHTYVRLAALWHGLADHMHQRENRDGSVLEKLGRGVPEPGDGEVHPEAHPTPDGERTNDGE